MTTTPPDGFHEDDIGHVLLDALNLAFNIIDDGEHTPWEGYGPYGTDIPGDPKATREGYVAVMHVAFERVEARLSAGLPIVYTP